MDSTIRDFSDLVQWLVAKHHAGNYYEMAKRLRVSSGLPYQWRDRVVKAPSDPTLNKMIDAYGLDYWQVMAIITGRPLPTPPTSPTPRTRRRKPTPISGGSDAALPRHADPGHSDNANDSERLQVNRTAPYRKWLETLRRAVTPHPPLRWQPA